MSRVWPLVSERSVPEADATIPKSARERPGAPGNLGVWAPKKLQFWTSRGCMSLGALHFVPRARWRIYREVDCEMGSGTDCEIDSDVDCEIDGENDSEIDRVISFV